MDQLANYRDSPPINFPVVEVGAMSAEHGVVDIVGCKGQTEADNGLSGGYQVEHTQGAGERKHGCSLGEFHSDINKKCA